MPVGHGLYVSFNVGLWELSLTHPGNLLRIPPDVCDIFLIRPANFFVIVERAYFRGPLIGRLV